VFALSGLGDENDVPRVKRGYGIEKFENHWSGGLTIRGGRSHFFRLRLRSCSKIF